MTNSVKYPSISRKSFSGHVNGGPLPIQKVDELRNISPDNHYTIGGWKNVHLYCKGETCYLMGAQ
jgi:hypothetical protein